MEEEEEEEIIPGEQMNPLYVSQRAADGKLKMKMDH